MTNGLATATTRNEKNDRNRGEDRDDPDDQVARPGRFRRTASGAEPREDEQPEEERPRLTAPEGGDLVRRRKLSARRLRHVREREVVAEERGDEHDRRDERREERRHERVLRRARKAPAAEVRGGDSRDERVDDEAQRDDERGATQLGHGVPLGRAAARLRRVLRRALRDQRARHGDERPAA